MTAGLVPSAAAAARTPRPPMADLVLAAVLAVFTLGVTLVVDQYLAVFRRVDVLAAVLVVGAALALVVRRIAPVLCLAVATACTSGYLALGYAYGAILLSFLIAVYSLARYLPPRVSGVAATIALPVLLLHLLTVSDPETGWEGVVPGTAWVVVPYAVGVAVRYNRQTVQQERARVVAEQLYGERMRLAQDVHDVVGHHLAAIKMQSDVALHVMPKNPAQAEQALRAISASSGDALAELRSTLAELMSDRTRSPTPGLARIDGLVERMRAAGLQVVLERSGTVPPVPGPVDVAGYRVVQESLTNVLRHGPVRRAVVRLDGRENGVTVTISNPVTPEFRMSGSGPDPGADSTGMGIAGMQQRVAVAGGRFEIGVTDGNFRVSADFPAAGS